VDRFRAGIVTNSNNPPLKWSGSWAFVALLNSAALNAMSIGAKNPAYLIFLIYQLNKHAGSFRRNSIVVRFELPELAN
jgi:hypothetical protein